MTCQFVKAIGYIKIMKIAYKKKTKVKRVGTRAYLWGGESAAAPQKFQKN